MATVQLVAGGGQMTVVRRTAAYAFGAWQVTWPDGTSGDERDPEQNEGYVYEPPDAPQGVFDLAFVRADVRCDIPAKVDDFETVVDAATRRSEGAVFFETDITGAGLGRWTPGVDFHTGDMVGVRLWGKTMDLPVTAVDMLAGGEGKAGWRVHVGGQLLVDAEALRSQNDAIERALDAEKQKQAGQQRKLVQRVVVAERNSSVALAAATDADGAVARRIAEARKFSEEAKKHSDESLEHSRSSASHSAESRRFSEASGEFSRSSQEASRASVEASRSSQASSQESQRFSQEAGRHSTKAGEHSATAGRYSESAKAASVSAGSASKAASGFSAEANKASLAAGAAAGSAEDFRRLAENARAAAERFRNEAEQKRKAAEDERKKAETARSAAEGQRKLAEAARASAEAARSAAEGSRAAAETLRNQAEKYRDEAEKKRSAAEAARSKAETARSQAETARANADKARTEAVKQVGLAAEEAKKAADEAKKVNIAQDAVINDAMLWRPKISTGPLVDGEGWRGTRFAAFRCFRYSDGDQGYWLSLNPRWAGTVVIQARDTGGNVYTSNMLKLMGRRVFFYEAIPGGRLDHLMVWCFPSKWKDNPGTVVTEHIDDRWGYRVNYTFSSEDRWGIPSKYKTQAANEITWTGSNGWYFRDNKNRRSIDYKFFGRANGSTVSTTKNSSGLSEDDHMEAGQW